MSRRKMDMKAEQALARFLDQNLYEELRKEGHFSSIHRADQYEQQVSGIDVTMTYKADSVYIDEKAALYYINQDLSTFAFELSYQNRGEERLGWFLNDQLKTTHYLLLWPDARTSDLSAIQAEDFTVVDALLISKAKLKAYLEPIGLDDHTLLECARILRQHKVSGRQSIPQPGMSIYVSSSGKYSEAPINLVIKKYILRQIADAHYCITPNGFTRV